jgi:hypothetical protein
MRCASAQGAREREELDRAAVRAQALARGAHARRTARAAGGSAAAPPSAPAAGPPFSVAAVCPEAGPHPLQAGVLWTPRQVAAREVRALALLVWAPGGAPVEMREVPSARATPRLSSLPY